MVERCHQSARGVTSVSILKHMKKVFIASDHAGFALKETLKQFLSEQQYDVEDCGPIAFDADDDYPEYILPCAQKVAQNKGTFGIVVGLSGQGEAIAANRIVGARAAVYYGAVEEVLVLSRQHNDANILSLGAKFLTTEAATKAVLLWLSTDFSGDERHVRRVAQLDDPVHNLDSNS